MRTLAISAVLLGTTLSALARPVHDVVYYEPQFKAGTYEASIKYNGAQSTLVSNDMNDSSAPLTRVVSGLSGFYWGLRDDISQALRSTLAPRGVSLLTPGGMTGDMFLNVTGTSGGNLQLAAGGFNYDMYMEGSKYVLGIKITCRIQLRLNGVQFQSTYNPYTGAVSNANVTYNAQQSVDCSNSLDWMPLIGDLINNKAQSMIGGAISQQASSWSGRVLDIQPQRALFGFTAGIQPGKYMVNGFDAGAYLLNNLNSLYVGKSISIFVANEYKYEPHVTFPTPQPDLQVRGNRFSVEFSDASTRLGFQIDANKTYGWRQRVIPGTDGPGDDLRQNAKSAVSKAH